MIRIRELREARGWNQKDLADQISSTRQAVGHYETGRRSPDLETLGKLCDVFGVTADYLLGRSDMPQPLISDADWRVLDAYHRATLRDRQLVDQILAEYAADKKESAG